MPVVPRVKEAGTPTPTRLLIAVQGCGEAGQPCCPPPSDLGGSFTCNSPSLACANPDVDDSYDCFLTLQSELLAAAQAAAKRPCLLMCCAVPRVSAWCVRPCRPLFAGGNLTVPAESYGICVEAAANGASP